LERYIENGTLRLEWRDFPYLGNESRRAAVAARAAQEQGKFWDYHDVLFDNQRSPNSGAFSNENLAGFAWEVGLDMGRFEAAIASGEYEAVVEKDFREGQDAGISSTPSFIINGRVLVGPQPLETFEQVIEEEARKAEGG
jgi:protein-disulfide isomerase